MKGRIRKSNPHFAPPNEISDMGGHWSLEDAKTSRKNVGERLQDGRFRRLHLNPWFISYHSKSVCLLGCCEVNTRPSRELSHLASATAQCPGGEGMGRALDWRRLKRCAAYGSCLDLIFLFLNTTITELFWRNLNNLSTDWILSNINH